MDGDDAEGGFAGRSGRRRRGRGGEVVDDSVDPDHPGPNSRVRRERGRRRTERWPRLVSGTSKTWWIDGDGVGKEQDG